jgi:hypothetical protein
MRICSRSIQTECGKPLGLAPRSLAGRSLITSSNLACAPPPAMRYPRFCLRSWSFWSGMWPPGRSPSLDGAQASKDAMVSGQGAVKNCRHEARPLSRVAVGFAQPESIGPDVPQASGPKNRIHCSRAVSTRSQLPAHLEHIDRFDLGRSARPRRRFLFLPIPVAAPATQGQACLPTPEVPQLVETRGELRNP